MKSPEQAHPETQKVDWWLPGPEGSGKWGVTDFNGDGGIFSLGGGRNVLELYSGDGCTTLNTLKPTELCSLKW